MIGIVNAEGLFSALLKYVANHPSNRAQVDRLSIHPLHTMLFSLRMQQPPTEALYRQAGEREKGEEAKERRKSETGLAQVRAAAYPLNLAVYVEGLSFLYA